MKFAYLDTLIAIYLVEGKPSERQRARTHVASLLAAGFSFAISDLTRLECLVRPLRQNDALLLQEFAKFHSVQKVIPLPGSAFDRAAQIRATHGFKLADALHLAAAIEFGCDRFLTNDQKLARFPEITVEILP